MDIRSINNKDQFIDRNKKADDVKRSKLDKADASKSSGSASKEVTDDVSLSSVRSKDEVEFAKSVLENLRKDSFADLKSIKRKIKSGAYDQAEVHGKIGERLEQDLSYIESLNIQDSEEAPSSELSPELKEKLTNNEEVLNNVSERLLRDLLSL